MNNIIEIIIDINNNAITVSNLDTVTPNNNTLSFKVKSIVDGVNDYIEFTRFKYGFFVKDLNDVIVEQGTYPPVGDLLLSTDGILSVSTLNLEANSTYALQVYAENVGVYYDINESIVTPKFDRPYDNNGSFNSWTWDDTTKIYQAPTEKPNEPEDGLSFYKWDESLLSWELKNIN